MCQSVWIFIGMADSLAVSDKRCISLGAPLECSIDFFPLTVRILGTFMDMTELVNKNCFVLEAKDLEGDIEIIWLFSF